MTFDPTKPVQTRDGRPARILCTDRKCTEFPIVAVYSDSDGTECVACYKASGGWSGSGHPHSRDLVNVPEKRVLEAWMNVYDPPCDAHAHQSKERADFVARGLVGRIACIHIKQEYTVGEGL